MKKIEDKQFKELLLQEMIYFDKFCRENGIRYFLFYGSLIGAAREKGFIAWDDDIDLVLPRSDYNKLLNIFNQQSSRYKLISMHNQSNFTAPLAKIVDTKTKLIQKYGFKENLDLGIYLDIFIFDGLPSEMEQQKKYLVEAHKLTKSWLISVTRFNKDEHSLLFNILRFIYRLPYHLIGYKHYLEKIDNFAKRYDFDECDCVSNLMMTTCDYAYPRKYFNLTELPFEGHNFIAPSGYDELLTLRYGDWRTPPKKEAQKSHHKYECYLLE